MKRKRKIRKIFKYIFYTITFVILSLICLGIIFYASGYRINPKSKKIEKLGILLIDYKEDGLKVSLDGKEINARQSKIVALTSAKYVANVLPGEYDVELSKEGKTSYKEHVVIYEELITRIDNPILIPDQIKKEKIGGGSILLYSISPNAKKAIYQKSDGQYTLLDFADKIEQPIVSTISDSKAILFNWSNDDKKVIIKYQKNGTFEYYLFDTTNLDSSYIIGEKQPITKSFENIFFSPKNSNEILGMQKGILYKVQGNALENNEIEENIDFIIIRGEYVYYHETKNNQLVLLDTAIYAKNILLDNFKPSNDFDAIILNGKNIFIKDDGKLFLIKDKNNLEKINDGVNSLLVSSDGSNFFYTRGYEVWDYGSDKNTIRLSKNILNLREYYKNYYFVYRSDNKLDMIAKNGKGDRTILSESIEQIEVLDDFKILTIQNEKDGSLSLYVIDLELK